jgi:hypothetical protein
MNFATAKMPDTQSVLADIATRVPIMGTDIPPLAWIARSSRFSSFRAVNARKLPKVNPANTEAAELFQCDAVLFASTAQQREVAWLGLAWPRLRPASIAPPLYLNYYKDMHAIIAGQERVSRALLSRKLDASLPAQFLEVYTINTSRSGLRTFSPLYESASDIWRSGIHSRIEAERAAPYFGATIIRPFILGWNRQ